MRTGPDSAEASSGIPIDTLAKADTTALKNGGNDFAAQVIAQATQQVVSAIGPISTGPTKVDE